MTNPSPENVMLAIPCGAGGQLSIGTARAIIMAENTERTVYTDVKSASLLTFNFNQLWATCLNSRAQGKGNVTRFVMLHSDIILVQHDWIDALLDLLNETGADVLSTVVPIKDHNGLTSTAVDTNLWRPRRLTMREIMQLPETFCDTDVASILDSPANLLVNTGLMAIRFDRPWVEEFPGFTINDTIRLHPETGMFEPYVQPEDWNFSRWCNAKGLKVMATRKVRVQHAGCALFNNWGPWGTMHRDEINTAEKVNAAFPIIAPAAAPATP